MDIIFFLGAVKYLNGNEQGALDVYRVLEANIKDGVRFPPASPKFFERFGKLTQALGESRGDELHRFMQRYRLIPWQDVGRLGAEQNWMAVEPWNFSREATQFFPASQQEFGDLRKIIDAHVLPGWLPELAPFSRESSVLTMGSCFAQNLRNSADCVSKSTLRVAIHELLAEGHANLHYWPSFEIVRWLGSHIEEALFGEDGNTRHVNRKTVRLILESFIRHYYAGVSPQ